MLSHTHTCGLSRGNQGGSLAGQREWSPGEGGGYKLSQGQGAEGRSSWAGRKEWEGMRHMTPPPPQLAGDESSLADGTTLGSTRAAPRWLSYTRGGRASQCAPTSPSVASPVAVPAGVSLVGRESLLTPPQDRELSPPCFPYTNCLEKLLAEK